MYVPAVKLWASCEFIFASQQAKPAQTFPLRLSSDLNLAITCRNSARNPAFSRIVCVCNMVAWENSRYSVWGTTAEIWPTLTSERRLQKFHTDDVSSPAQIWVVLLIGRGAMEIASTNQKHYADLESDTSSLYQLPPSFLRLHFKAKPVVASRNVVCFLRLFNNYSLSPNGLWVNSPWGRRPNGLLTPRPFGREE